MFNINPIISNSVIFLGGLGFVFGLILGFAGKKFKVETDPREDEILSLLPGVNCGACGFPGCVGYAAALVKEEAEAGKCTVISAEKNIQIGKILGKDVEGLERKVAVIMCCGGEKCKDSMIYSGIKDCRFVSASFGSNKACSYGCLGFGSCISSCQFGAITSLSEGGVPVIDLQKCTGCGMCVSSCPKKLIKLVPFKYKYHILCSSEEKGPIVRQACKVGCIGCGICVKLCPKKDISLQNNIAEMNYENCDNCGICLEKCPVKCIIKL